MSDQNKLRDIAVKYAHLMWVTDYSYLLKQASEIERLTNELRDARKALEEIAEGKGRYNTDPLTHASNTVEDMIALATEALANKQERDDER